MCGVMRWMVRLTHGCIPECFKVPFPGARSFMMAKMSGVIMITWIAEVIMPPRMGAAMGPRLPEPR